MKVLVATNRTQGLRKNDYDHCIEGELVWITLVCAADAADPDGACGCGRGFGGLNSHRATSTARVADLAFTRAEYREAIRSSLAAQGWPPSYAAEIADDLLALAASWPVDAVVERRLDDVRVRSWPARPGP
jgi:hypothetical protein